VTSPQSRNRGRTRTARRLLAGASLIALALPANPTVAWDTLSGAGPTYEASQSNGLGGSPASWARGGEMTGPAGRIQVADSGGGCGDTAESGEAGEAGAAAKSDEAGEAGEAAKSDEGGEAGEAGEAGERGFDAARAECDRAAYLNALEVIRAHYLAGQAAYADGRHDAAVEMFVHPMSEIYADFQPVLEERGVAPFGKAMEHASAVALQGKPAAEVNGAVERVFAALDAAAQKAPDDGRSPLSVETALVADFIDRAALQYQAATRAEESGEGWLDGYGYYQVAVARAGKAVPMLREKAPDAAREVEAALAVLKQAYPSATQPDKAPLEAGQVLAASSKVNFAVSGLIK
jgi:hypothetical protein